MGRDLAAWDTWDQLPVIGVEVALLERYDPLMPIVEAPIRTEPAVAHHRGAAVVTSSSLVISPAVSQLFAGIGTIVLGAPPALVRRQGRFADFTV
jgi:hypothetical protein